MTEALVYTKESIPNLGEMDNMEMTCALPNAIQEKNSSNANISRTMKVSKPDESGMEMTEALVYTKESIPNHGEMDNMEMTCALPKEIMGKSVSTSDENSTIKISKPHESGMEMTEALPFQKESVPNHEEMENMEMTCAIPTAIKGATVESKLNMSSNIKLTKLDDTLVDESNMEMTKTVAPHMISLPSETIETAKTTKDNHQEI